MRSKKEIKSSAELAANMLKIALESTGLFIGFDKNSKNLVFFDKQEYLESGTLNGYKVSLESINLK